MINNSINPLLKETIVFRPMVDTDRRGTFAVPCNYIKEGLPLTRYAGGKWIPDDGEPDLAFVLGVVAYGVHMPNYTNILWSWRDIPLAKEIVGKDLERYTYGWHYQTTNNKDFYDYKYKERDSHPNEVAYTEAMNYISSRHGCANGRGIYLTREEDLAPYFSKGLVWVKSTMQPIKKPANPVCFLCLNGGLGHKLEASRRRYGDYRSKLLYANEHRDKLEIDLYDTEHEIKHLENILSSLKQGNLYDPEWEKDDV